jgi:hypothetical protein
LKNPIVSLLNSFSAVIPSGSKNAWYFMSGNGETTMVGQWVF